jgi:WD40 repeat protein
MEELSLSDLSSILNDLVSEEENKWPSPVAARMSGLKKDHIDTKARNIVAFLDSLGGFLGSVIISIYINDKEKKYDNQNFNRIIVDKFFRKPATLGDWVSIIREGIKHFSNSTDFFIPELITAGKGIKDPLGLIENDIEIVTIKTKEGLFDDLNTYRLSVGHPKQLSEYLKKHNIDYNSEDRNVSGDELAMSIAVSNLIRLMDSLKFFSDYWLFYIKTLRKIDSEEKAEIQLYNSPSPHHSTVNIDSEKFLKDLIGEEGFKANEFRHRLFLARVKKTKFQLRSCTSVESIIEVNPVLINWLKDKDFLPYQFEEWKSKNKKRILMGEIIYLLGKEEINQPDICKRLKETYDELKKKLGEPQEKEDEEIEKEEEDFLNLSQSSYYYNVVRKEIYQNLNIAEEILAGIGMEKKSHEASIDVQVSLITGDEARKTGEGRLSLRDALESLWNDPTGWNCVLLGEGGMGKTTSLLKLWKSFLKNNKHGIIPVFLRLEGYNNIIPERRRAYIWYAISREYHNRIPSEEEIKALENQFSRPIKVDGRDYPSVILFLDGFNEVTAERTDLFKNLNEVRKCRGCQIIVSSRYDMRSNFNWKEFECLILEKLEDEQIKNFMEGEGIEFDRNLIENIPLLRNPMMLTLYCGTEREMKINSNRKEYNFIDKPRYKAEILHNFINSSLARLDLIMVSPEDKTLHRLYLCYVLPRIGYEMEKAGLFEMGFRDIINIISEELRKFISKDFLLNNPSLAQQIPALKDFIYTDNNDMTNCINVLNKLIENYCQIRKIEGDNYSFLHQDFRDYFAAVYIKNRLEDGIKRNENNFPEFKERLFPYHLRSMLGELTGEPRRRPVIKRGYQKGEVKETLLDHALDLLRHIEIKKSDYRILNILEIFKEKRVDLSDTDLSCLDLRQIVFNNVRLGYGEIGGESRGADLSGSRLRAYTILHYEHSEEIFSINYSPDGKRIVSGNLGGKIKEWDVETGECIRTYEGHSGQVFSVSYSHDGERIVSGSWDNTIKEWKVRTGECIRTYEGHSGQVFSVSYSYDGERIVSGSLDNKIKEWDAGTGECIKTYEEHFIEVISVSYSPDGTKILSGSWDNTIKEWDVTSGECIKTYEGHSDAIPSISYSPDGTKILSGSWDNTIKEWDVTSGECIKTYEGHSDAIPSISYSPDGTKILSGSWDNTIKEWDVTSGECIKTYEGHSDAIPSISYSPDGTKILSGSWDDTIREWDIESGECIKTYKGHSEAILSISYSPDGTKILSLGYDDTIKEWNRKSGECIKIYEGYNDCFSSVSYSPDGRRIASVCYGGIIKEWDTESGKCIRIYKGYPDTVNSITYSSNNKRILSGCSDRTVKEWDTESGKCIRIYDGNSSAVTSVSYSPDGRRIISGYSCGNIKEWDTESGECIRNYEKYSDEIISVSYSPDGRKIIVLASEFDYTIEELDVESGECVRIYTGLFDTGNSISDRSNIRKTVSGSNNETTEEWDIESDECIMTCEEGSSNIEIINYSPDGRRIISGSGDGTIKEWDVETGECIKTYEGHSSIIKSVNYSPDGRRIISVSSDGTIKEWDVETGECIKTYEGHSSIIKSIKHDFDSKRIISISWDNTVKEWDMDTGECIEIHEGHFSNIQSVNYTSEGKRITSVCWGKTIMEWDVDTGECIRTIKNIPGLLIQGVDMSDLHSDSEVNEEEKELLKQYGAMFDGHKKSKTDIVILEQTFGDSNTKNKR